MFLAALEMFSLILCVPMKMGDKGGISWASHNMQGIDLTIYNGARIYSSLL